MIDRLRDMCLGPLKNNKFACSLASQDHHSEKQKYWINKLIDQVDNPKVFLELAVLLRTAHSNGIKWPKLRMIDGYKITYNHEKSRITIMHQDRFKASLDARGMLLSGNVSNDLERLLRAVCSDPREAARNYGQRTGNCCFCGHTLTHRVSRWFKYGPICAERWGLDHGYCTSLIPAEFE